MDFRVWYTIWNFRILGQTGQNADLFIRENPDLGILGQNWSLRKDGILE